MKYRIYIFLFICTTSVWSNSASKHRLFCCQKRSLPYSILINNIYSWPTTHIFSQIETFNILLHKIFRYHCVCINSDKAIRSHIIYNHIPSCSLNTFLIIQHSYSMKIITVFFRKTLH